MKQKPLMNIDEFSAMLVGLAKAFERKPLPKDTALEYWKYLKDVPKEFLERRVKHIILTEDKFPTIAKLSKRMWEYGE